MIDPNEAEVIRKIFRLYNSGEMGTYRIACHLTEQGIVKRDNAAWNSGTILNMIKNETYTGVLKFGNACSDYFSHLRIIDNETFMAAQMRVQENKSHFNGRKSTHKDAALIADILYCMHCGKRMTVTVNTKTRTNKKGDTKIYRRLRYMCLGKSKCNGQTGYSAERVDSEIQLVINQVLSLPDLGRFFESENSDAGLSDDIAVKQDELEREKLILKDLEQEVVNVIRGTSAFGSVLLGELIRKAEGRISEYENQIRQLSTVQKSRTLQRKRAQEIGHMVRSDGGSFASLPRSVQLGIIRELVEKVTLGRGYQCRIEWTFGGITEGNFKPDGAEPSSI